MVACLTCTSSEQFSQLMHLRSRVNNPQGRFVHSTQAGLLLQHCSPPSGLRVPHLEGLHCLDDGWRPSAARSCEFVIRIFQRSVSIDQPDQRT